MNMDNAMCNALKYQSFGLPQALVIYDIECQWIINFPKWLKQNHLSISEAMELLVAMGKFHRSAHIQECFVLYSLNFMYGSGLGLPRSGLVQFFWKFSSVQSLGFPKPRTVTKSPLRTSRTVLRHPIRFLLRRPNRRQDRRSLRRSFPENLITCIIACIPHVTHHVQSSRDSRLSRFHKVSELLSQPPPVSIWKTYSHTHNSRAAQ